MLRLARTAGESIWIGDDIEIRIMNVKGGRAHVGVICPRDLKVLRGELRRAIVGDESEPPERQ